MEPDTVPKKLSMLLLAAAIGLCLAPNPAAFAQGAPGQAAVRKGASGLPLPRFVSLKSDRVNVRKGPSTDHAVDWVFSRAGLPVEVIAESDNWRQVRDADGSEGWVFHSLLSGRRTALVTPWAKDEQQMSLYQRPNPSSGSVARVEPGVLGILVSCDGEWCDFSVNGYSGWIEQERLWGVYSGERLN
jgi:SH3-like domain-containing protein